MTRGGRRLGLACALAVALTAGACGGKGRPKPQFVAPDGGPEAGGGVVDPAVPLADFRHGAIAAYCDWNLRCVGGASTHAGCVVFIDAFFGPQLKDLQKSAEAGFLAYDEETAADCLEDLRRARCNDAAAAALLAVTEDLPSCAAVWAPKVAPGGPCYADTNTTRNNCTSGYCRRNGDACPGECSAHVATNASCAASAAACDPTSDFCDPDTDLCVPKKAASAACAADAECAVGLWCRAAGNRGAGERACVATNAAVACEREADCTPGLVCAAGTCAVPLAAGDPCTAGEESCAAGLACIGGQCAAAKEAGDACLDSVECAAGLCAEGRCRPRVGLGDPCDASAQCPLGVACEGAGAAGKRCGLGAAAGSACAGEAEVTCAAGLRCDVWASKACVAPPDGAGDPCANDCPAGFGCDTGDTGTCVAARADGADCTAGWQCAGGLCTAMKCASGCP